MVDDGGGCCRNACCKDSLKALSVVDGVSVEGSVRVWCKNTSEVEDVGELAVDMALMAGDGRSVGCGVRALGMVDGEGVMVMVDDVGTTDCKDDVSAECGVS